MQTEDWLISDGKDLVRPHSNLYVFHAFILKNNFTWLVVYPKESIFQ